MKGLAERRRFINTSKINQRVQMRPGEIYSDVKPQEFVEGARFAFLVGNRSGFWREITSHIPTEEFIQLAAGEKDSKLLRRLTAVETRKYSKNRKELVAILKKRVHFLEGLPEQEEVKADAEENELQGDGVPAAGMTAGAGAAPQPQTQGGAPGGGTGRQTQKNGPNAPNV